MLSPSLSSGRLSILYRVGLPLGSFVYNSCKLPPEPGIITLEPTFAITGLARLRICLNFDTSYP